MILRAILSVGMIGLLAGCATTRPAADSGQLQIRVAQLESKLEERDQEVEDLKYELKDLAGQIDDLASTSSPSMRKSQPTSMAADASDGVDATEGEIIRVAVGAQDVQRALKNAGYYNGAIDGKVGSGTKRAIKEFQKDHDLTSDGIIGKKTWNTLKSYLNN